MAQGERVIRLDEELHIEAYRFEGVMQAFPNHFHEYYVLGFIEAGLRRLQCRNREYRIAPGDVTLFNPGDCHACAPVDDAPLDYRCLNVKEEVMRAAAREITGQDTLPRFDAVVVRGGGYAALLRGLHRMVMEGGDRLEKQEAFLLLLGRLLAEYAGPAPVAIPEDPRIEAVCAYLDAHYAEPVSLDELAAAACLNKYSLLRAFVRARGITPYRYLEAVRVGRARQLLQRGASPAEAALQTGFADQSHFSNFFMRLIGLTPGQYRALFAGGRP